MFGPVLHVLRFRRERLDALVAAIDATGYGLTFGIHSRIAGTVARVTAAAKAGNIYVNRNMVGAVVGVQPFGGHGLSGTGPKAGGPLYLRRLLARRPAACGLPTGPVPTAAREWRAWVEACGFAMPSGHDTLAGSEVALPGPVGEENLYRLEPRGTVLCLADARDALVAQVGTVLATGNRALVPADRMGDLPPRPPALAAWIAEAADRRRAAFDAVLFRGGRDALLALGAELAARPGPIVQVHTADAAGRYPSEWLLRERSISSNTTAAGGNAHLMMIG